MNWENVRYFLQVARTKQILAAARRLNADHATVSRRIAVLEDEAGVRLFDRHPKGVELTTAGERLLRAAEAVEAEFLTAQADIGQVAMDVAGSVRIAAPDVFGALMLSKTLIALKRKHPRLTVQVVPLSRGLSLPKREADLAVTIGRPREGRLAARKLVDYSLHFYAAKDYLRRRGMPGSREELKRHTIVTYVPDLLASDDLNLLPDLTRQDTDRLEYASALAQIEAVREGAGIGMLHDYAVRHDSKLKLILPSERSIRSYWLVSHLDNREILRNRIVLDFITAAVVRSKAMFVRKAPT
jgi:DNA-binding transcriptional LysR family regulator